MMGNVLWIRSFSKRGHSYFVSRNVTLLLPEPPPNKVCFNFNLALYFRGWGCPHGRITTPLRRETLGKWKSIELYVSALNWGSKGILKNCTLSITRLFGRKNDGFFNVFTEFIFFPTDTLHIASYLLLVSTADIYFLHSPPTSVKRKPHNGNSFLTSFPFIREITFHQ